MKKIKVLAIGAILIGVIGLFAGCGSKGSIDIEIKNKVGPDITAQTSVKDANDQMKDIVNDFIDGATVKVDGPIHSTVKTDYIGKGTEFLGSISYIDIDSKNKNKESLYSNYIMHFVDTLLNDSAVRHAGYKVNSDEGEYPSGRTLKLFLVDGKFTGVYKEANNDVVTFYTSPAWQSTVDKRAKESAEARKEFDKKYKK